MTERTASCACGRMTVTVPGEPAMVGSCHCDFCQRRTGSPFQVCAYYAPDAPIEIEGETTTYNGLETDGEASASGNSVTYHFCSVCGSTVYWNIEGFLQAVAVGNFMDPDFPAPTLELNTRLRHHWVPPVPDAQQFDGEFG